MTTYYLALNGPRASGKSTLQHVAIRAFAYKLKAHPESFAAPIKQFMSATLGMAYSSVPKDVPLDLFKGETPREVLIKLFNYYLEKSYGPEFFGHALVYRTSKMANHERDKVYVVDDCGKEGEFLPLPRDRTVLVRVYRPGFDFTGDNRSYLSKPDRILMNDGDLHKAESLMEEIVSYCLAKWRVKWEED